MRRRRAALAATVLAAATLAPAAGAGADALAPVSVGVSAPSLVSLDNPIAVSATVDADAGAFAQTHDDLRLRVRLAAGCASTFAGTSGPVLLDRDIGVVPTSVGAFHAVLRGTGRAGAFGVQTVCAFLEEVGSGRLYAFDDSTQVDVSRACTLAGRARHAAARDVAVARRSVARARPGRHRRHLRRRLARYVRALRSAQAAERRACSG